MGYKAKIASDVKPKIASDRKRKLQSDKSGTQHTTKKTEKDWKNLGPNLVNEN